MIERLRAAFAGDKGPAPDPEIERLRAAFAGDEGPAPDPERCPAPGAILSAVRGELPPKEIRAIVEHTAVCPTCAEEWRLAVEFEKGQGEPALGTDRLARAQSRRWHGRLPAYAAAAAAVLVLALGVQRGWKQGPSKPPVSRGGFTAGIQPVSDEEQPAKDCVLRWEWPEHPQAAYHVEVFEPGGDRVTAADVTAPEYPLCAGRGFHPGTRLQWRVRPASPLGSGSASEAPQTFDLRLQ